MNFIDAIFFIVSAFLIAGCIACLLGIYHTYRKGKKNTGGKDK